MALGPRLNARTGQTLFLSQKMRSALSVLRLSNAELAELIDRELARNPFLRRLPGAGRVSADLPQLQAEARVESLHQSLLQQIAGQGLAPQVAAMAGWLVGELREDGYLDAETQDRAQRADAGVYAAALAAVQRCDPAGVGARSLSECIALQLIDMGLPPAAAFATTDALAQFARGDHAAAARRLGVPLREVQRRAAMIATVRARPVDPAPEDPVLHRADLVLVRDPSRGNRIELAGGAGQRVAALGLDHALARAAQHDGFGEDLLQQANALLAALEARGQTLLRLGFALLQRQPDAFLTRDRVIRPLTQVELAQDLGLHPSTVSRALRDKVIDIDGRLWPVSSFFSRALPRRAAQADVSDAGSVSAASIRASISARIAREDPARPLSDTEIARQLQSEGVDIARRTVAKYRQGLRIPSTAARRRRHARRQGVHGGPGEQ
jgi:RNA polymerase sigma-54 factor